MTVDLAKLIERLERLARIARRALETNKTLSVWSADPETLEQAAEALSHLSVERDAAAKRIAELEAECAGTLASFAEVQAEADTYCKWWREQRTRAETAERQRDEAIERTAKVAESFSVAFTNSRDIDTVLAETTRNETAEEIAIAIRSLNSPGGA